MNNRQLGKTGLSVSALSYGTWQTFGETVDLAGAEALLTTAYDIGIRCFDGAEAYAMGKADEMMGRVLQKLGWPRDSFVVTGKCIRGGAEPYQVGVSRKRLVTCCDTTLRRYGIDYLDIFFCHRPDGVTPPEEIVITMNALLQQGKILYWGTSEFDPVTIERMWQFADRHGFAGPVVEQTGYNLLSRQRVEKDLLPVIEKWGMGLTVYSPLAVGQLSGKYNNGIPEGTRLADHEWLRKQLTPERQNQLQALQKIANDLALPLATLSLAWVLKNPNVSTAILGARHPDQITRNVAAVDNVEKITPAVLEQIEEALAGSKPS